MSNPHDHLLNEQIEANKQWLADLAQQIQQTATFGSEIENLKWLVANNKKIIRNKNLIDLIG